MEPEKYFSLAPITGRYQTAVAKKTAEALMLFCEAEPEFKQAVEQSGMTFQQCLDEAVKGIGKSISDEELYTRAVQFYFPGAVVRLRPWLDLTGSSDAPEKNDFESLLDF